MAYLQQRRALSCDPQHPQQQSACHGTAAAAAAERLPRHRRSRSSRAPATAPPQPPQPYQQQGSEPRPPTSRTGPLRCQLEAPPAARTRRLIEARARAGSSPTAPAAWSPSTPSWHAARAADPPSSWAAAPSTPSRAADASRSGRPARASNRFNWDSDVGTGARRARPEFRSRACLLV